MAEFEIMLMQLLLEAAHHPTLLFGGIVLTLFASSFGLPLPEEVILITSGLIASTALNEAQELGITPSINPWTIAMVCFAAVLISDLVVFTLGRRYGLSLLKRKPFQRIFSERALLQVQKWTEKYGALACCLFRFTPGIRFPGHFMCGALKITYRKFLLTDGVAALLTVPTQVLLIAFYGQEFLSSIKEFKIWLFLVLALLVTGWLLIKLKNKYFPREIESVKAAKDNVA